jgi:two-component system chemotaxis response regulator CheB
MSAAVQKAGLPAEGAIQVLVVDDSLVIRGTIARILGASSQIAIAGTVQNGQVALDRVAKGGIDVVVLDIEMPVMDGLTALPRLLAIDPELIVIMASTLTARNAEISLQAMNLGASDYVPKPTSASEIYSTEDFRRELTEKVLTLGARRRRRSTAAPTRAQTVGAPLALAKPGRQRPRVLAIGSSTGGPNALVRLFSALPRPLGLPIVITQHMPAAFTAILAKHLSKETGWDVSEAKAGDILAPDRVFVAPGDQHLLVVPGAAGPRVVLDQGPKENFCRPAVDPMLRSLVAVYGPAVLAVVLTGMGQDGLIGAKQVVSAGGTVIAQDEATSVVWGMPGAVVEAGLATDVRPLDAVAQTLAEFARGGARS